MGVVGAFLLYLYWPRGRRTYLYVLPMLVGALAKSPAVMFAPLFLVYVLLFEQRLALPDLLSSRSWRPVCAAVRVSLPVFLVGGAMFVFVEAMHAQTATYGGGDRLAYLLTQSFVWLHYMRLFFVPLGLTADTDLRLFSAWYDTRVVAGLLGLAVLLRVLWSASRAHASRPIAFGLAWFGLALVPTSSVFPLAEVANEHRVFLPYIGLALASRLVAGAAGPHLVRDVASTTSHDTAPWPGLLLCSSSAATPLGRISAIPCGALRKRSGVMWCRRVRPMDARG